MKNIIILTTIVLSACSTVTPTQKQPIPVAGIESASDGLSDLNAMTFICPKSGLNAVAREVAKVPSQGHYQFSYFKIINDSHHSLYEIHFKSNHHAEADLKYCVSVYCQQGQEPVPSVSLISNNPQPAAADAAQSLGCANHSMPGFKSKRLLKKQ
jgi:hypothetical protein